MITRIINRKVDNFLYDFSLRHRNIFALGRYVSECEYYNATVNSIYSEGYSAGVVLASGVLLSGIYDQ